MFLSISPMNMLKMPRLFFNLNVFLFIMLFSHFGCSAKENRIILRSDQIWGYLEKKLLPFVGTKREDVEIAYGKHVMIVPHNETIRSDEYIYHIATHLSISVKYGIDGIVMWSSYIYYDDNNQPLLFDNILTDIQKKQKADIMEHALQEIKAKKIPLPWLSKSDQYL